MASKRRTMIPEERERWRCLLCDRGSAEIGIHPLPVRQSAHLLANRFTGAQRRYGGAKNLFTDPEWAVLLQEIGPELPAGLSSTNEMRKAAMTLCYQLCGECHEEVLSEPIYLPSVMNSLRRHFKGKSRVEKMVLLARVLKMGTEALDSETVGHHK